MRPGVRSAVYDRELNIEAYSFDGVVQEFPNHVHDYYVIGLIERGRRRLVCMGREYEVSAGDVMVFNPGDGHACTQLGVTLQYRALNIPCEVMLARLGRAPRFAPNVLRSAALADKLRILHTAVTKSEPGGEEALLALLGELSCACGERALPGGASEVERARDYIERNFAQHVALDDICREVGMSKSALHRAFTASMGVTPYRYLESVRVGEARRLLENGVAPADVADLCGFADQSHLTNCFGRLIGLSPGAYREIFCKDGDQYGK